MIEQQIQDGIATVRLAHGKVSALDFELLEAICHTFRQLADSEARAVVLTGSGGTFSAGVDLVRLTSDGSDYVARFLPALDEAFRTLFEFPRPVIAAVNGHAIAGGCILAQSCDYRLMAQGKGRIGVPELLVGVQFPALALEIMRFTVPPQHLRKLVLTGATLLPDEALQHGLVDEVVAVEELGERAVKIARQLAAIPGDVFVNTKRHLRRPVSEYLGKWGAEIDGQASEVWRDPVTHEGIRAYLQRTLHKS
jgi:enoyl-CoA hydratase